MLQRFRARFEFRWRDDAPAPAAALAGAARRGGRGGCALAALAVARAAAGGARCRRSPRAPRRAQLWLEQAQNADGGFGDVARLHVEPRR